MEMLIRKYGSLFRSFMDANLLEGYRLVGLTDDDDFEDHDIERDLVDHVTGGTLPAIYLNLSFDLNSQRPMDSRIESLLSVAEFVHVLTYPEPVTEQVKLIN